MTVLQEFFFPSLPDLIIFPDGKLLKGFDGLDNFLFAIETIPAME